MKLVINFLGVVMLKRVSLFFLVIIFFLSFAGMTEAGKYSKYRSNVRKQPKLIRVPGGANIPSAGLAVDASYDPRLDDLVPGYKVINVAVFNQSLNIITLDPSSDRWWVKFADGKKKKARYGGSFLKRRNL